MRRVLWFMVPGQTFPDRNGNTAWGEWVEPHRIYIAQSQLNVERTVRHEMLHDLLGDGGHHQSAWRRCGLG
jgi:hypothetical protein